MKFILIICLSLLIIDECCGVWKEPAEEFVEKDPSWIEWFSLTFYKCFYVFLMSAILCCTLFNFIKNKFTKTSSKKSWSMNNSDPVKAYSNVLSFLDPGMKKCLTPFDVGEYHSGDFPESENQLRERLKLAQEEIQNLRIQLTSSMDTKTELETSLAMMDKEKIAAEMQLELDRVEGAVEIEKLKKENLHVRREIQKLLEEKDEAEKEAERLERDVRISRSAAIDADFLEDRLGTVKKEAELLKHQFSILAQEKERASSVLSDIHLTSNPDLNSDSNIWVNNMDADLMSLE